MSRCLSVITPAALQRPSSASYASSLSLTAASGCWQALKLLLSVDLALSRFLLFPALGGHVLHSTPRRSEKPSKGLNLFHLF